MAIPVAIVIKSDGKMDHLPIPREGQLEKLQKAVGGLIEILHTKEPGMRLVIDDEGLIKGKPVNFFASQLYGGTIVGDAVLCRAGDID